MGNSSNNICIPEISDEELRQRADRIKPLVRKDGILFFITEPNLRGSAFIRSPELAGRAPEMCEVARITTYHTYGYPGLFKPSVAEVLAQIPGDILANVSAFEVAGPADVDDLNREPEALRAGFHVAETILYA